MSTLGDAADPLIKFLPHTLKHLAVDSSDCLHDPSSQLWQITWQELDYRIDICRVTKGGRIEHLWGRTETWSVSPFVDMIPFDVTIPAAVPQRSEIPEGLINYPILYLWK
jgi:rhamnogalacturonyl hydrolase YesR